MPGFQVSHPGQSPTLAAHGFRLAKRLTIALFDPLFGAMSRGGEQDNGRGDDREFNLLVAACRRVFDPIARLEAVSPASVDWERFLRLARFHRAEGLAWSGLESAGLELPDSARETLRQLAQGVAARNLAMLAASADLLERFNRAGVPLLFVKGLPLGVLAYGSPWLKAAVDVDLLIDEARLQDAVAALRACGYRREGGRPEEIGALRAWHRLRKDSEWAKAGSTARVDLHTRLTDHRALIPTVGLASPRQLVEITPGCRLPTLSTDEMFAHLCVHGASSAWFRLKWITDLAALLHPMAPDEIARLQRRSQELGAGRAAGQALLLADTLFGTLNPCPELRVSLRADNHARRLCRSALRQLSGRPEPVEPTARLGGTLRIHLTQFLLLPGIGFKASELVRQARAAVFSGLSRAGSA